jgi:hypothetical protein
MTNLGGGVRVGWNILLKLRVFVAVSQGVNGSFLNETHTVRIDKGCGEGELNIAVGVVFRRC